LSAERLEIQGNNKPKQNPTDKESDQLVTMPLWLSRIIVTLLISGDSAGAEPRERKASTMAEKGKSLMCHLKLRSI